MTYGTYSIWADDNVVARLKELLAEGLSMDACAIVLAGEFNIRITRNAVAGHLHRQRYPRERITIRTTARIAPAPMAAAPGARKGVPLMLLRDNSCRYIIDESPTRFCGQYAADPRRPWCAAHHHKIYVPARGG